MTISRDCIKVQGRLAVFVDDLDRFFPVALSDINNLNPVNLRAWMRHLNIRLAILTNFNTTRLEPIILRI
jgi:hypothetical protein